jgi:hypothetical protein
MLLSPEKGMMIAHVGNHRIKFGAALPTAIL